jgi:hypothetical protein
MKKNDFDKLVKKYEPVIKKTRTQLAKAVKSAEEDISKMYKIAGTHVEIQMKNLQKEKLYYELGKYVAERLEKGGVNISGLEKYKKRLDTLNTEGAKMHRKLSRIGTKAKNAPKKKAKKK